MWRDGFYSYELLQWTGKESIVEASELQFSDGLYAEVLFKHVQYGAEEKSRVRNATLIGCWLTGEWHVDPNNCYYAFRKHYSIGYLEYL